VTVAERRAPPERSTVTVSPVGSGTVTVVAGAAAVAGPEGSPDGGDAAGVAAWTAVTGSRAAIATTVAEAARDLRRTEGSWELAGDDRADAGSGAGIDAVAGMTT